MSQLKARSDFFEQLCCKIILFSHEKLDTNSGDIRKTFFRLNNTEEALAGQVQLMHFPCMVHLDYSARGIDKGGDERLTIGNQFLILARPADGSADAVQDAYTLAENALELLIAYMLNTYEENGSCGPFKQIELGMFSWQAIGPEMDGLYGFELTMREEQRPAGILHFNPANYS